MIPILLGVDVGTTNLKVIACAEDGSVIAKGTARTPIHHPRPNWAHHDPHELWNQIAKLISQTTQQLDSRHTIAGVAAASMGESGVLLDAHGEPTYPIIAWFDNRTEPQVEWWQMRSGLSADAIFAITGLPLHLIFGVNKILWLRENEPDAFKRAVRWLNVTDYVAFKLSGEQATDYSLASRTMALDLSKLCWSDEIARAAKVPIDLFARLVPSGETIGRLTDDASRMTGLPSGTPVVSGGHDHVCGSLAVGITQAGDLLDSIGTSEAVMMVLDAPVLRPEVGVAGYQQGAHVARGQYYMMGGMYTSGACVDWIIDMLLRESGHSYDAFLKLAAQAPPGSDGVFFLPHMRIASPPNYDPDGRGAFIGLTADTSRNVLARAVLEGIAYEAHLCASVLAEMADTPIRQHVVIGGGARNELLLQIKASLANRELCVVENEEATALGAAALAGIGAGVFKDAADVWAKLSRRERVMTPTTELVPFYAERYEQVYKRLYQAVRDVHHAAVRITSSPSRV